MAWDQRVRVDGYEFIFMSEDFGGGGVLVTADADFSDNEYVDALQRAVNVWSTFANLMFIREMRDYWYGNSSYNRNYVDRAKTIDAAWQYITQDDFPVEEWAKTFIEDLRNGTPKIIERPRVTEKKKRDGFVYLLQQVGGTHYKIGYSKNPESRNKTFGIQLPFDVEFICLIKTDDMIALELELHEKFASKRGSGEWFALNPEDVEYIKGLAT